MPVASLCSWLGPSPSFPGWGSTTEARLPACMSPWLSKQCRHRSPRVDTFTSENSELPERDASPPLYNKQSRIQLYYKGHILYIF
ncbi:hypothetical protein BJX96DRAFT_158609 [Aspergillus floccosus]